MELKGMATCKVCGRDFALMAEEHYIARNPKVTGAITALVNSDKACEYDAFDCPHCGCQYVAQERKPVAELSNDEEKDSFESFLDHCKDGHGCDNCKYESSDELDYPCNSCCHCIDYAECKYEPKEEN